MAFFRANGRAFIVGQESWLVKGRVKVYEWGRLLEPADGLVVLGYWAKIDAQTGHGRMPS